MIVKYIKNKVKIFLRAKRLNSPERKFFEEIIVPFMGFEKKIKNILIQL